MLFRSAFPALISRSFTGRGRWGCNNAEHANGDDLQILAKAIKNDVRQDRFALIQVFTSANAAKMRQRLNSLTEQERATYHKSYVAIYSKNANAGIEEMVLHPNGMDGPHKTIKP